MIADIVVAAVLLVSAVIAFLRGFIREVLTILGVVGGAAASYAGGPVILPQVNAWLGVEKNVEPERLFGVVPYDLLAQILSYGLIFIVVVIALSILSHIMASSAKALGLGAVDRTLGVIFGIARGVVLLGLVYLPFYFGMSQKDKDAIFAGSRSYVYLERTAQIMEGYLPESTKEKAGENVKKLKDSGAVDLLHQQMQGTDEKQPDSTPPAQDNNQGYTDDFRQKMDELFDQKSDPGKKE